MKLMTLTVLGLLTASFSAMAVTTKDCPKKLTIEVGNFKPYDEEGLKRAAEKAYADEDELKAAKKAIKTLDFRPKIQETLTLDKAEKAQCRYANYDGVRAKMFTRQGTDYLRLSYPAYGGTRLGFYIELKDYSTEALTPEDKPASIVYEISDKDGEFSRVMNVGDAKKVKLTAEEE